MLVLSRKPNQSIIIGEDIEVVVLEVEDYHASMNLYKAGDLDYSGDNSSPPSEYLPLLATKKDFVRFPYLSTYWYELNTKKPPLDDEQIGRAHV